MRALIALAIPLVLLAPSTSGATQHTAIYAHRGGADLAPENTLGAFRQAHGMFPDVWLEMDVQLTADGVLVVIHDDTLDRTTDCTGDVIAHTAAEVAQCDARDGWPDWPTVEPVPTFAQVLAEGKDAGWRLLVELKNIPGEANFDPTGGAAAKMLIIDVEQAGFPAADIAVQSFFPTSLDAIESARPDIATALLTTSQLPGAPPGAGFPAVSGALYATARGYEISAPDHTAPDLSPETVQAMQALGRKVVVWTADEPVDIARALTLGVDGIISDRPDLVYNAL
jgi:glycerophosphoryl diester phosphodiesterase